MGKNFFLLFVTLQIVSCTPTNPILSVPSHNFSLTPPPANWERMDPTVLSNFPMEFFEEIPEGLFTAFWAKNNGSMIGMAVGQLPDPGSALPFETMANSLPEAIRYGFKKEVERLRATECEKDLETTIDRIDDRVFNNGIKANRLEASVRCSSSAYTYFLKFYLTIFSYNNALYSFKLISPQSDFERDSKVLDAMIESLVSPSQTSGQATPPVDESPIQLEKQERAGQIVKKQFIRIEKPDVVFAYGEVKCRLFPGDTLEVMREKVCRTGSGRCWIVKHRESGETGAVAVRRMEGNHTVYFVGEEDELPEPSSRDAFPRIFIEIKHPDTIYKGGKAVFTVDEGDVLEVLMSKTCPSGQGECWGIQDLKSSRFGFVKADRMRSTHRISFK